MSSDIRFLRAEAATISFQVAGELSKILERCTRTCLTCERFDEPNVVCNKYGGTPPPRIIAFGCDGYEDKVPF